MAKMISSRRSIPVAAKYAEIGRRSPIGLLTERQRRALVKALSPDVDPVAVTAMRYWHPLTAEAIDELKRAGSLDEIVLLPLYPHFSFATTLSSLKEWNRVYGNAGARAEGCDGFAVLQSSALHSGVGAANRVDAAAVSG